MMDCEGLIMEQEIIISGHKPWMVKGAEPTRGTNAAYLQKTVADVCLGCMASDCLSFDGCDAYRAALKRVIQSRQLTTDRARKKRRKGR